MTGSGRLPSRSRCIRGRERGMRYGTSGPRRQHGVSHLNSDRVSVPSIEGPARYARGSWTERFAISTTIRALRLPRNQRDSYIDDLGKTDVYLGQRDRRWNAASRGYSSRISWAGFRGGDFVSCLNRRLIRHLSKMRKIRKEIVRMILQRILFTST